MGYGPRDGGSRRTWRDQRDDENFCARLHQGAPKVNSFGGATEQMTRRGMILQSFFTLALILILAGIASCSSAGGDTSLVFGYKLSGPLISSRTTMATAWEFPKNPLADS